MEQLRAREDFDAARFKAFRKAIRAVLTRSARRALPLDTILAAARLEGQSYGGEQEIPLDRVVGSAAGPAKRADFDPGFLPVSRRLRDRWSRIYTAMVEGDELPPIDVYKLGDSYYVIDGHHRVSVARNLGRDTIKGRVVEVRTRAPLGPTRDRAELLRAAEYATFLEKTELDRQRPGARLEVSRLGRYDEIFKHIGGHRYFMGLERGQEVSIPEAAASWYDSVYLPVVELIRQHKVLDQLHGWTETDLYGEITRRWLQLADAEANADPHQAVHELLDQEARHHRRRRRG